jgi:hypothetical protein
VSAVAQRGIEELLAEARSRIARSTPAAAHAAAWAEAGLPVVPAPAPEEGLPGMGGPQ